MLYFLSDTQFYYFNPSFDLSLKSCTFFLYVQEKTFYHDFRPHDVEWEMEVGKQIGSPAKHVVNEKRRRRTGV